MHGSPSATASTTSSTWALWWLLPSLCTRVRGANRAKRTVVSVCELFTETVRNAMEASGWKTLPAEASFSQWQDTYAHLLGGRAIALVLVELRGRFSFRSSNAEVQHMAKQHGALFGIPLSEVAVADVRATFSLPTGPQRVILEGGAPEMTRACPLGFASVMDEFVQLTSSSVDRALKGLREQGLPGPWQAKEWTPKVICAMPLPYALLAVQGGPAWKALVFHAPVEDSAVQRFGYQTLRGLTHVHSLDV